MRIVGITRIRNEEKIIQNTLDYVSDIVDYVYVYDDSSTDSTIGICKDHKIVKKVIENKNWDKTTRGRQKAEGYQRSLLFTIAILSGADWIYYFDADEYIEFVNIDFTADSYYFRLFDFYITEKDKNLSYLNRKWMGPEYRDIPMLFKPDKSVKFRSRVPSGIGISKFGGYAKHYGKAVSEYEWERKCTYYSDLLWKGVRPDLQKRWEDRKGKAIHTVSDFGRKLIRWEDRFNKNKIIKI